MKDASRHARRHALRHASRHSLRHASRRVLPGGALLALVCLAFLTGCGTAGSKPGTAPSAGHGTPRAVEAVRGFRLSGFRIRSFEIAPDKSTFRFANGHLSNVEPSVEPSVEDFRLGAVSHLGGQIVLVFTEDVKVKAGLSPTQVVALYNASKQPLRFDQYFDVPSTPTVAFAGRVVAVSATKKSGASLDDLHVGVVPGAVESARGREPAPVALALSR